VSQAVLPVKDATNTSRSIDAWSLGGGAGSLRQAAVLGDPSVDAAVAAVKNGQVDPSNYGLVVRRPALALPAHRVASGTSGDFLTVKNSAGVVHLVSVSNYAAYPIFLKFFDKATTPVPGTDTVVWTVGVQAGIDRDVTPPPGVYFTAGISYAIVKGIADANATNVAASDCVVDVFRE
jgi:hypothetical protein